MDQLPPIVDAAFVHAHRDELVLVDLRWSLDGSATRDDHRAAHVPGAVYVDLDTVASGPPSRDGGRHPLPTPADFADALGQLGIASDDVVVAMDQGPGVVAARLVWMLRAIGQPAALLDGGVAGWDGELESGEVVRAPVRREPVPWPAELLAEAEELRTPVSGRVVIDARAAPRYRGEVEEPGGAPAGHIPGARSVPVDAHLAQGRLRPVEELRTRYEQVGALEADDVVAYCGSGVSACLDLLALETVGGRGRLFVGSWSAWSADDDNPIATGADPDPDAGNGGEGSVRGGAGGC